MVNIPSSPPCHDDDAMVAYYHNHPTSVNNHFSGNDQKISREGKKIGIPDTRSQWPGSEIPLNMQIPQGVSGGVYVFRGGKWVTLIYARVEIKPNHFKWKYFQMNENGKLTEIN
jgi:hypothetical protein